MSFSPLSFQLFLIEGDFIQLREGAHKMIAATAAVAKVAAAAAASSPYSSYMPTVAVTPMAQSHRLKKSPSTDSNGACFSVAGGLSNVKILSKPKDSPENSYVQPSAQLSVGNGGSLDRLSMINAQNSVPVNGRLVSNFISKQQTQFDISC